MPDPQVVGLGDAIPVEGRMLRLCAGTGRGVRIEGESLLIPAMPPARACGRRRS